MILRLYTYTSKHPFFCPPSSSKQVCYLHDVLYCKCESVYAQRGLAAPSSAAISLRSLGIAFGGKEYYESLDKGYLSCIHQADKQLVAGKGNGHGSVYLSSYLI